MSQDQRHKDCQNHGRVLLTSGIQGPKYGCKEITLIYFLGLCSNERFRKRHFIERAMKNI